MLKDILSSVFMKFIHLYDVFSCFKLQEIFILFVSPAVQSYWLYSQALPVVVVTVYGYKLVQTGNLFTILYYIQR